MIQELSKLIGVEANYFTPYHHQTQGKIERSHGTLEGMLKAYLKEHTGDWNRPRLIPYLTFAMNEAVSTTLHYSPSSLVLVLR
jgi:hypothetical protein